MSLARKFARAKKKEDSEKYFSENKPYQEMLARKKEIADKGISPEEREAFRSKMAQQMSKAEQATGLRMGAAVGGAQGASVAAQQRSLLEKGLLARAGIERDIFLGQEKAKREGLQVYGDQLESGMRFDIGTKAQEKAMQFQKESLKQQLESAEKQAAIQSESARQAGKSKGLLGLGIGPF